MSGTKLKLAAGVLTVGVLSTGVAYAAAIPSDDGTITACYKTSGGLLTPKGAVRVVDSDSECHSYETALTWNQTGEPGPAGPVGPQGDTGAQGPPGPAGSSAATVQVAAIPPLGGVPVSVMCPAGQRALGGGSSVANPQDPSINLLQSHPITADGSEPQDGDVATGWQVQYALFATEQSASVYVICTVVED